MVKRPLEGAIKYVFDFSSSFTENEACPIQASVFVLQPISSDTNAENLSATYEPHVCLAKEAFLQLLSNSVGFPEAWELPVWVKVNPAKGTNVM